MPHPNPDFPVPSKVSTVAMWSFLGGLTMLFVAGMFGYLMIRLDLTHIGTEPQPVANSPKPLVPVHLSPIFVVSTLVVLVGSVTIQRAVGAVRRERQAQARQMIWATLVLAVAFCAMQLPGLIDLARQYVPRTQDGANVSFLLIFLIVLHALHIVGGIVYLAVVANRAALGRYDHEHYVGIKHAALYWHFLDVVWLVMYGTMLALG